MTFECMEECVWGVMGREGGGEGGQGMLQGMQAGPTGISVSVECKAISVRSRGPVNWAKPLEPFCFVISQTLISRSMEV